MPLPLIFMAPEKNLIAAGSHPPPSPRSGILTETSLPSDYQLNQQGVKLETSTLTLPQTHGEIINTNPGDYVLTSQAVVDPMSGAYGVSTYEVNVGAQQFQAVSPDPGNYTALASIVDTAYRAIADGAAPLAAPVDQQAVANTVAPSLPQLGTFIATSAGSGRVDTGNGVAAQTVDLTTEVGAGPGAVAEAAADVGAAAAAAGAGAFGPGGWGA